MKKSNILLLSLALICLCTSFTIADGWKKDDKGWMYQKNDSYCFNTFIDVDGKTYYIADNGYCVTNSWIKLNNSDWYYASQSGELYKNCKKVIDNKVYVFDGNGKLRRGWIDGLYYANDQGYLVTGWQQLPIDKNEVIQKGEPDTAWYYFNENGEKTYAKNDTFVLKTFQDRKYCFDQRGILQTGWVELKDTSPKIKGCMYFTDVETSKFKYGQAITNTWYAAPSPVFANMAEDVMWYYFTASGFPKCGAEDNYQKVRIENKYYMFNDLGNPVNGIRQSNGEYYYFGNNRNDCSMKTGAHNVLDGSGSINSYYFRESSGEGYTGVKNNKLYFMGRLQKAEPGSKYQGFYANGNVYLVNTSGVICKNKKAVKDADGNYWTTNSMGIVVYTDGQVSENILPEVNVD